MIPPSSQMVDISWSALGCGDRPDLPQDERTRLTAELVRVRGAVGVAKRAGDRAGEEAAHEAVDAAKRARGELGPVWLDKTFVVGRDKNQLLGVSV